MQALSSSRLGRYQSMNTHSSRYNACRCPLRCPAPIFRRVAALSALEDESLTLADLKAQLEDAVEREDYDLAARIRDTLQCVFCCCCASTAAAARRSAVLLARTQHPPLTLT